jgi:hypothetical protein
MTIARDTTWWSDWIREDVQDVHACAENAFAEDVGVLFHEDAKGSPRWLLCSTWAATEDDVASGKAPEVGDILSATELPILSCPFCGVKLSATG